MEKAYKNIVLFFITITVIVFLGFYNTYFVFFPDFDKFKTFHHVHAIIMILWLLVLIVQPILINKRKYKWHRAIGKVSYVLVPVIVISMLIAYKYSFLTSIAEKGVAHSMSLNMLFLPLTDVLPFTTFYMLAIINRKKVASHFRYMISTAVVVVSAGLLRLLMTWLGMDFMGALYTSIVVMVLVFVSLIIYDFRNGKLKKNKSFLIALLIFSIPNLLLLFVPYTSWWRTFAEGLIN
ncbi:MAG: hypothetical protein COA50_10220 [Flavobacteriaceae bacterium]|nr:MAG: hypothetical protein COA50_10220 [Flavobacteriaceae bacterium]